MIYFKENKNIKTQRNFIFLAPIDRSMISNFFQILRFCKELTDVESKGIIV